MRCCLNCKFYEPVDNKKGTCFGFNAKANDDANKCPVELFKSNS